jgi:hypothetical protein
MVVRFPFSFTSDEETSDGEGFDRRGDHQEEGPTTTPSTLMLGAKHFGSNIDGGFESDDDGFESDGSRGDDDRRDEQIKAYDDMTEEDLKTVEETIAECRQLHEDYITGNTPFEKRWGFIFEKDGEGNKESVSNSTASAIKAPTMTPCFQYP